MITPPKPDRRTLGQLEDLYRSLYRDRLGPTLADYSAMAAEALALQVAIYTKRLAELCQVRTLPRALCFCARSSMADFDALMEEIKAKQINVVEILHDPVRQEFHLFAKP